MPRAGNSRARSVCSHYRGLPTCRGGEGGCWPVCMPPAPPTPLSQLLSLFSGLAGLLA